MSQRLTPICASYTQVMACFALSVMLGCDQDDQGTQQTVEIITDAQFMDIDLSNRAPSMDAGFRNDQTPELDMTVFDAESDAHSIDATIDDMMPDSASERPTGPIEPPEGTDGTPEDMDFDWDDVPPGYLSNLIPSEDVDWTQYPRYGQAQIISETESEECVCFDLDCTTCSRAPCGPETCTYDLNDAHTLTKYQVELSTLGQDTHTVRFEVNISADPPIAYTDISDVLNRLERVPTDFWYGLKIITQFGRGIQFLHGSYFNGAAAYGSMNYIDTQTADLPTLFHELGHTFEQYTRIGDPPALAPQSNILNPIWRHAIRSDDNRTSPYGSNNEWEDLAEFARLYALAAIEGSLSDLERYSPERYRIWRRILLNGVLIAQ